MQLIRTIFRIGTTFILNKPLSFKCLCLLLVMYCSWSFFMFNFPRRKLLLLWTYRVCTLLCLSVRLLFSFSFVLSLFSYTCTCVKFRYLKQWIQRDTWMKITSISDYNSQVQYEFTNKRFTVLCFSLSPIFFFLWLCATDDNLEWVKQMKLNYNTIDYLNNNSRYHI